MKLNLTLLESNSQISAAIMKGVADTINVAINKSKNTIISSIKNLVTEALRQEPEYASLMSGKLKADLGIPDSSVVESIINALVNTINLRDVPLKVSNNGIRGGFIITMIPSNDFGGVISQNISMVQDDKGYSLPWLEWLLLRNNEPIVKKYEVKYGSSPYSRSGLGIMVPSDKNWRVPPEFAGSANDNWTTRAISRIDQDIYNVIRTNIEKNL